MDAYLATPAESGTMTSPTQQTECIANEVGHWIIAKNILLHLDARDLQTCRRKRDVGRQSDGTEVLQLVAGSGRT